MPADIHPVHGGAALEGWTTSSGVRVLYAARRSLPIVDLNIDFEAGSFADPPGKAGLSEMVASLLLTGQKRYGALPAMREEAAEHAFDDIGAKVAADAQADRIAIGLRSLSQPVLLARALLLLSAMLAAPSWAARPFERERERLLAFAEEQLTDPEQLCNLRLTQALYEGHPFGVVADADSIAAIGRQDVAAFHRQYFVRSRAIITLVGDLDRAAAERIAETLALALPVAPADDATAPDAPQRAAAEPAAAIETAATASAASATASLPPAAGRHLTIDHPASQAHIVIGTRVPGVGDADYFPLMIANRMFSWRLNDVVRDRLGLAYEVSSALFMSRLGEHRIALKTRGDQAQQALDAVRETLRGFVDNGVDAAEFDRTRRELIDGRPLAFDSNAKLLRHAADIGFDRLPLDHLLRWPEQVAAVTLEQALATFAKWINPARQTTLVLGERR
ncbi:MAG: M16 family metallopeptidase [Janthinobacterium lividum]